MPYSMGLHWMCFLMAGGCNASMDIIGNIKQANGQSGGGTRRRSSALDQSDGTESTEPASPLCTASYVPSTWGECTTQHIIGYLGLLQYYFSVNNNVRIAINHADFTFDFLISQDTLEYEREQGRCHYRGSEASSYGPLLCPMPSWPLTCGGMLFISI